MSELIKATYEGQMYIGDMALEVAMLEDGTRVITQSAVFKALDRPVRGNARLINTPVFMDAQNLQPFINQSVRDVINKIEYLSLKGKVQEGYNALILPRVSDLYLKAREAGVIKLKSQKETAQKAEVLVRALADVGILAMVDEATGYLQAKERSRNEFQEYLDKFIAKEAFKWVLTFPDEFFEMIFKMKNWTWRGVNKQPQVMGHYINDIIYSRIAPGLLKELQTKNPKLPSGTRKHKHHSWLTKDTGHPKLKEHFSAVEALGKASGYNWDMFMQMLDRALPKYGQTMEILFPEPPPKPNKLPPPTSGDKNLDEALGKGLNKGPMK